jgi:hypothetical protein
MNIDQFENAGSRTRAGFLELGVQTMKLLNTVRVREARTLDSALGRIGLQRRENPARPLALFFVGAAVAGAAALLFAPTSGRKARRKIRQLLGTAHGEPASKSIIEVPRSLDPKADGLRTADTSTPTTDHDHSHGR